MLRAKFKHLLHQLRLAARLKRNFKGSQPGDLHVKVANPARPFPNPIQHPEQLFLLAALLWQKELPQNLQSSRRSSKAVDMLRLPIGSESK